MHYSAKVIADSVSERGHRLTTMEVRFPRIVLSQFNTHRALSRNSASSRAIPIEKVIARVMTEPFVPERFGANRPGMLATEDLPPALAVRASAEWLHARDNAVESVRALVNLGVHKEQANRLLEPFLWHTALVTATDWDNFFALRCDDAQHEIKMTARAMREALESSKPVERSAGDWHTPYVTLDRGQGYTTGELLLASVGRCGRVSYLTHDGTVDVKADIALAQRLKESGHMSPFEHVARPMTENEYRFASRDSLVRPMVGNFCGWVQYRKQIPHEDNFGRVRRIGQ
jgi:thymidylate synthase ThyX